MSTEDREQQVVFLSAVRTGFGAFGGTLKELSATDLGAIAARSAMTRAGITPADLDHVVFGNVLQTSPDAPYLARHVGLLAGGTESMSQAPHAVRGARWGLRFGQAAAPLEDTLWEALRDSACGLTMGETAENLGERYGITRHEVDAYALRSQMCAQAAWESGAFADEIVFTPVPNPKTKRTDEWAADEHIRPDTTIQGLAKLPPVFRREGLVTAGNASGICDGAAALIVAGDRWAECRGLKPLGRLVSWAVVGVEPKLMGIGPAPAARKALARAGLPLSAMDLVEVNEAFAAQYLAVERDLGLDRERTNVDGGAIALGHPLAASGARITAHLLHALHRRGGRYGLGSACIGGGQGVAVVVELFAA